MFDLPQPKNKTRVKVQETGDCSSPSRDMISEHLQRNQVLLPYLTLMISFTKRKMLALLPRFVDQLYVWFSNQHFLRQFFSESFAPAASRASSDFNNCSSFHRSTGARGADTGAPDGSWSARSAGDKRDLGPYKGDGVVGAPAVVVVVVVV